MSQTFEDKALYRIRGTGVGWAFTSRDFLDLGGRSTVDFAVQRVEKRGEIRRVIRGIYDYPRFSKLLDQSLSPDIDQVARALARKFRWRIQPSGATALNFLGLSTQVPARAVYLSDGPDRVYQIGNTALKNKPNLNLNQKEISMRLTASHLNRLRGSNTAQCIASVEHLARAPNGIPARKARLYTLITLP